VSGAVSSAPVSLRERNLSAPTVASVADPPVPRAKASMPNQPSAPASPAPAAEGLDLDALLFESADLGTLVGYSMAARGTIPIRGQRNGVPLSGAERDFANFSPLIGETHDPSTEGQRLRFVQEAACAAVGGAPLYWTLAEVQGHSLWVEVRSEQRTGNGGYLVRRATSIKGGVVPALALGAAIAAGHLPGAAGLCLAVAPPTAVVGSTFIVEVPAWLFLAIALMLLVSVICNVVLGLALLYRRRPRVAAAHPPERVAQPPILALTWVAPGDDASPPVSGVASVPEVPFHLTDVEPADRFPRDL